MAYLKMLYPNLATPFFYSPHSQLQHSKNPYLRLGEHGGLGLPHFNTSLSLLSFCKSTSSCNLRYFFLQYSPLLCSSLKRSNSSSVTLALLPMFRSVCLWSIFNISSVCRVLLNVLLISLANIHINNYYANKKCLTFLKGILFFLYLKGF